MNIKCIVEEKLDDQSILRLNAWSSGYCPILKKKFYLLELVGTGQYLQYPRNRVNFTETQIIDIFCSIESRADLEKIIQEQNKSMKMTTHSYMNQ